jgi:hypothetical protein
MPSSLPTPGASTCAPHLNTIATLLLCGPQVQEVEVPGPVTHASLSARSPFAAAVSFRSGPPALVQLEQQQPVAMPLEPIDLEGEARQLGSSKSFNNRVGLDWI